MTPGERPWLSSDRPPWVPAPRPVPWALRAARAVFVVSALVVLDPARAVHILGEVLDGYRKDGGW